MQICGVTIRGALVLNGDTVGVALLATHELARAGTLVEIAVQRTRSLPSPTDTRLHLGRAVGLSIPPLLGRARVDTFTAARSRGGPSTIAGGQALPSA